MLSTPPMIALPIHRHRQSGASLIEVLVAILLLSFGMLSLGAMLSFAVQAPKLSGYRAIATNLANDYVERIRANPFGFDGSSYSSSGSLSYDGSSTPIAVVNQCAYAGGTQCTPSTLAAQDEAEMKSTVRAALPAGGLLVTCDPTACGAGAYGNLWIMWQEPSTVASLDPAASDNCPSSVSTMSPKPRCLYVRFKVD